MNKAYPVNPDDHSPVNAKQQAPHLYTAHWFLEQGLLHMEDRASTYDKQELGGERSMQACVDAFIAVTGDGLVNTAERA